MKAERTYGDDVGRKLGWVLAQISCVEERRHASLTLGMDPLLLEMAARALAGELRCLRPGAFPSEIVPIPPHPRQTHMVDASLDGCLVTIRQRPSVGEGSGPPDNPMGPAIVSHDQETYCLDKVQFSDMQAWQGALSQRGVTP